MRNWRTWSPRPWYSCLHWALYCASVGVGWPLAGFGAVFFLLATQAAKSGGCGIAGAVVFAPGCAPCEEMAATRIQWLKSLVVMVSPPTLATALPGTLSEPQALSATAGTARAPTASSRRRFVRIEIDEGSGSWLNVT